MYWIYLILFILIIFTPEVVSEGVLFFREEDLESLIIFGFGLIGLLLYIGKESALMRVIREKLSLQQESNQIRKDLVQSYSYIGEMNRHLDILKHMIVESPHTAEELLYGDQGRVYDAVLDATLLLAQSDAAALFFVNQDSSEVVTFYEVGDVQMQPFQALDGKQLLETKKYWWQADGLSFVRSSEGSRGMAAFLVFRSVKNRVEETGVFQILVTHALFLFSLREVHRSAKKTLL